MLAWTLTAAGGIGPVARQGSTIHGSVKSWTIARYIWIYCANGATYASNAADFTRYAKRPNDAFWPQLIGFPLSTFLVGLVGNLVVSSSQIIMGEVRVLSAILGTRIDCSTLAGVESNQSS